MHCPDHPPTFCEKEMFSRGSRRSTADRTTHSPRAPHRKMQLVWGKNVNMIVPQNSFIPNDFFQRQGRNMQGQEEDRYTQIKPFSASFDSPREGARDQEKELF